MSNLFKKRKKPSNARQKVTESDDESTEGTRATKKNKSTRINKSKSNAVVHEFSASGTAASLVADSATRTLDIDGIEESKETKAEDRNDGTYTGIAGYKEYVNKKQQHTTQSNAGGIRAGPLRQAANIRISSRFDYQPDICKDYKETGYCGYGDSCKFLHDRGDYKAGWQLDLEWNSKQKELDPNRFLIDSDESESESDNNDDDLPFACLICRQPFTAPIVTKCLHYFCEECAIRHYAKSPKCFACNAATQGVFNVAKDLLPKIEARRIRMAEQESEVLKTNQNFE